MRYYAAFKVTNDVGCCRYSHHRARYSPYRGIPRMMSAVLLTGHGGYECLEFREDVPIPAADANEVLIRVRAAGVNNTDINTRIGWYSKAIMGSTAQGTRENLGSSSNSDASWSGTPLSFPRIQERTVVVISLLLEMELIRPALVSASSCETCFGRT
jgi:hypothetical protein